MRRPGLIQLLILLAFLGPASVRAQVAAVAPAPSVLFAPAKEAVRADTTPRRTGLSVIEGGGLGATAGIILGAAFGSYMASAHPCSCDDPGLEPYAYGFLTGVLGFVVGASLADEERQARAEPTLSRVPSTAVTENGTPLTADSTRLVGKDPHGVRGGIAGALIGGAIGYAGTYGIYAIGNSSGPSADFGEDLDRGPSALALGVGTLTGAVSGYLIAAMLSKR